MAVAQQGSQSESQERRAEPEQEVCELDVAHGQWKERPLERMTMALPALTRLATNIVGGTAFGTCYWMGKIGEKLGRKKVVDSHAFRCGARGWLLSNGLVPKVVYEPV